MISLLYFALFRNKWRKTYFAWISLNLESSLRLWHDSCVSAFVRTLDMTCEQFLIYLYSNSWIIQRMKWVIRKKAVALNRLKSVIDQREYIRALSDEWIISQHIRNIFHSSYKTCISNHWNWFLTWNWFEAFEHWGTEL